MEYDEIDQYVDQLFRQENKGESDGPLHGEVLSGDWRIDRIDQIIEDAYNEAIWWHNHRISEGCDPRSGLRSLPYVPWDENIDGVAAMQGAIGGLNEGSFQRNGGIHRAYDSEAVGFQRTQNRGLSCAEAFLIIVVGIVAILFMMIAS